MMTKTSAKTGDAASRPKLWRLNRNFANALPCTATAVPLDWQAVGDDWVVQCPEVTFQPAEPKVTFRRPRVIDGKPTPPQAPGLTFADLRLVAALQSSAEARPSLSFRSSAELAGLMGRKVRSAAEYAALRASLDRLATIGVSITNWYLPTVYPGKGKRRTGSGNYVTQNLPPVLAQVGWLGDSLDVEIAAAWIDVNRPGQRVFLVPAKLPPTLAATRALLALTSWVGQPNKKGKLRNSWLTAHLARRFEGHLVRHPEDKLASLLEKLNQGGFVDGQLAWEFVGDQVVITCTGQTLGQDKPKPKSPAKKGAAKTKEAKQHKAKQGKRQEVRHAEARAN